ncbi:MAG: tetratricopeptide repeat protein [Planctomycetes bacterium]|nr:tetratricopeptide repeat protein [Planctomycetota bacterium]MCH7631646.1 tetratricopeptide repeat protein [Planctomycetota bacterium]
MPETLESIATQIQDGDLDGARTALDSATVTEDNKSELTFLRGYLHEGSFRLDEAFETYQSSLEQDPDHTEAAFRAAYLCDLAGDDEAAIELYERCTEQPPAHVNAMLNLAFLYEECGRLEEAESLVQGVLDEHPNHRRAYAFRKSIESSYTMVFDERLQRERDTQDAILDVPVSDFELSVRSRNCLKQMNIRTLGDLLQISEPELLSYRNFGDTSLNEIKAMLDQRGLSLGQAVPAVEPPVVTPKLEPTGDLSVQLQRPIGDLELSVRSRKCLQRLGVITLGELAIRSEAELLAIKNFGQTSLNEIKQQLATFGIMLRASN